jgi:hypothetical protein
MWIEIQVTLSDQDKKDIEKTWLDKRVKIKRKALLFVNVEEKKEPVLEQRKEIA